MKAHLAKVSLALLSAVFLLGCQEQGSEPVGPEGLGPQFAAKKCANNSALPGCGGDDGGDGDPAATTLTLADGMQTPLNPSNDDPLPVTVNQDSPKKLNVGNSDFAHNIKMNFLNPGDCFPFAATKSGVVPSTGGDGKVDEVAKLEAELIALVTSGSFIMKIDKTGLTLNGSTTSESHLLLVERDGTFDDPTDGPTHGHTRIMLGNPFDNQVPPNTVKWVSENLFEFTGPVVVWAHGVGGGGGEKSNRIIACGGDGDNKVTATINR